MKKIIVFFVAFAFGIVPLSSYSRDYDASIRIEIVSPEGEIRFGDTVRLRCAVEGVESPYYIQWQYLEHPDEDGKIEGSLMWKNLDCHTDEYEYVLTKENLEYYYRVIILCEDPPHVEISDIMI